MGSKSFFREGQPLKLPETKKTLLFTFNGERNLLSKNGNLSLHDYLCVNWLWSAFQCLGWVIRLPKIWTVCCL